MGIVEISASVLSKIMQNSTMNLAIVNMKLANKFVFKLSKTLDVFYWVV